MLIYHKHLFKVFQETNPNPGRGPSASADCQAKLLCIRRQVAACVQICQIFYLIIYEGCFTIRAVYYFAFSEETQEQAPSASDGKVQGCPGRVALLGLQCC